MSSYHGKCSFKSSRAFSNLRRLLLKKETLKIRVYDNKINITFNKSIISVFNRDPRPILFLHTIYILLTTPFLCSKEALRISGTPTTRKIITIVLTFLNKREKYMRNAN